jgi:hypothetical protein
MSSSSESNSKYLQHFEAETFISRYEAKYKREVKKARQRLNIKHMQALDLAAKTLGLQRHHHFLELIKNLKRRAHHFALQEDRIRCAVAVQPSKDQGYYWFYARLNLDDDGELMTRSISCCKTTWVGFVDGDTTREIRDGALVQPDRVQNLLKNSRHSLYVIDNPESLCLWLFVWGGFALVPESLVAEDSVLIRVIAPREYPPNAP